MKEASLEGKVEAALERLHEFGRRAAQAPEAGSGLLAEAIQELSTTLEELGVASEELKQQTDELAESNQALAAEQHRYEDLFELAPDAYLVTDANGVIQEANRGAAKLLGVRQGFLEGKPLLVFVDKSDHGAFHSRLTALPQKRGAEQWEMRLKRRDGNPFPAAVAVVAVREDSGAVSGLRWLVRDMTERRRAEDKLKDALGSSQVHEREVSALLESARSILVNREFNQSARAIFDSCKNLLGAAAGYIALLSEDGSENEVVFLDAGGLPCTVDPSLPMPIRGLRAKAYHETRVVYENEFADSEHMAFMPEGHAALHNVLFAPLVVGGRTLGLMGLANKPVGFNEEDARLAEAFGELAAVALFNARNLEALETSEERFRSVAESATDAIVSCSESGDIILWNKAAQEIFGYTEEEAIGRPLALIMPEDRVHLHQEALERLAATGESRILGKTIECMGRRKDGTGFPVELSLAAGRLGNGLFFTGIVRDITERKASEDELAWLASFPGRNPMPVIETDYEGNVTFANPSAASRFPDIESAGASHALLSEAPELARRFRSGGEQTASYEVPVDDSYFDVFAWHYEERGRVRFYASDATERHNSQDQVRLFAKNLEQRVQERTAELEVANEQLRNLAAQLSLAEERERRRIATYLHDSIVQTLGILKNRMVEEAGLPSETGGGLPEDIRRLVDEAIRDARSLTFELSPPILYELGLEAAVDWLAEQVQERYGLETVCSDDGQPKPLDDDVRVLLFQAVRELLVNAAKHSQAGRVEVSMWRDGQKMFVTVDDDGVGFDQAEVGDLHKKGSHFGLFSIRERLDHVGGSLDADANPGQGARFTLAVPLKDG